jgi:VWFA-related protein
MARAMTRAAARMAGSGALLAAPWAGMTRTLRCALSPRLTDLGGCLAVCLVLLAGAPAAGPARPQETPPPTIKVSTVVVNLYALVEDRKGHLVSNLNKEDFLVTEDHVRQQIQYFSCGTGAPLTLGMVVDTSPSQGSVLALEQDQAKTLLRQVLRPQDSAFVLQFDRRVELLQDLTGDQALLARAIDRTRINEASYAAWPLTPAPASAGGSHLYDAISFASNRMKNQIGRKVLVLLTDGEDLGSEVKQQGALEAAERADVILYSVALSDRAFYLDRGLGFHGDAVLKKLSLATGGRMSRASDAQSTATAFGQIGGELRGQYLLGYTPNRPPDGSFRQIRVEVRHGHGIGRVRSRRGYYAQPE